MRYDNNNDYVKVQEQPKKDSVKSEPEFFRMLDSVERVSFT